MVDEDIVAGAQSLDRAIAILRLVGSKCGRGIRLTEVTRATGLAKSTAHRMLRALERQGLIDRDDETDLYHLGPETFVLGTLAAERYGIHKAALPSLEKLSRRSGDASFLTALRGWHGVCLHRQEGDFPIRTHALQAGDRHPLGVGAGSLAILAALPDDQVEQALAANAEELAERYPDYSPEFLRDEVQTTRAQGYAINRGRFVRGSWAVGVAIVNRRGDCEGALSIAAIEQRLQEDRRGELAEMLHIEAARVNQAMEGLARGTQVPPLIAAKGRR